MLFGAEWRNFMGMTIAEKIIARAAKVEEAHAGNIYVDDSHVISA